MNLITYFVTLNWNTTELLEGMVKSVEATTAEPHKWIIIDNGSDEQNWVALCRWTHERFAGDCARVGVEAHTINSDRWYWDAGLGSFKAVIVRLDENAGCILGHNLAFNTACVLANGEPHEIVMIDTDVVINEQGWLSKARAWADEHPEVGIVGMEHGPRAVCAPAVFLDTNGNWYLHEPQMQRAEPVEGESVGLGFALVRWPVLDVGLRFDLGFKLYYKQDDDFCFQVRADLGLEVWVFPVGNIHFGSGSLQANEYQCGDAGGWDEFDQIKQANQRYFAQKWNWLLRGRRKNMEGEAAHLVEMRREMEARQ
jgi:GT2 family glycosyltransferase